MPDPNNIALRAHGIVFMLIPKVANTSIKIALADALGLGRDYIHAPDKFDYVDTKEAKTFPYRIGFVRDPLDRLLSCYRDKVIGNPSDRVENGLRRFGITRNMSFLDFIEAIAVIPDEECGGVAQHFRSQVYSLADDDGTVIPTVLGRFEGLADDWQMVRDYVARFSGLQLHLPELGHYQRTDPGPVTYCAKGRAFALQRYRDDVRIFGYPPARKYQIDPDHITHGRSICNVHREAYQIARDQVTDGAVSKRLCALIAEAFDMGKRMNVKLRGSQYEA